MGNLILDLHSRLRKKKWYLIFLAEYMSTTSKFRKIRKSIPLYFFLFVIIVGFGMRWLLDLVRTEAGIEMIQPPKNTLLVILISLSYFILVAPLSSPISRMLFDKSSIVQGEFLFSRPVRARDVVFGNFLVNVLFFLPLYSFLGMISLTPFYGQSKFSWFDISLAIFAILAILILTGLFIGTLISPVIYIQLAKQKNDTAHGFVMILTSISLLLVIPLIEIVKSGESPLWLVLTPMNAASELLFYYLYGDLPTFPVYLEWIILLFYLLASFLLMMFFAEKLHVMEEERVNEDSSRFVALFSLLEIFLFWMPKNWRVITLSQFKNNLRRVENIARVMLAMTTTLFILYLFFNGELFDRNLIETVRLAMMYIAVTMGAITMIYTEIAAFSVETREMLVNYKSAPHGTSKMVVGKLVQMFLIELFLTIIVAAGLMALNILKASEIHLFLSLVWFSLVASTLMMMGIYFINPTDNEEDITNLINLIVFFMFEMFFIVFTTIFVMFWMDRISWAFEMALGVHLGAGMVLFLVGLKCLDELEIETMSSTTGRLMQAIFIVMMAWLLTWVMPLFLLVPVALLTNEYFLIAMAYYLVALFVLLFLGLDKLKATISRTFLTKSTQKTSTKFLHDKPRFFSLFSLKKLIKYILIGTAGAMTLLVVNLFAVNMSKMLFNQDMDPGTAVYVSRSAEIFQQISPGFLMILLAFGAIIEELFFRGWLVSFFKKFNVESNHSRGIELIMIFEGSILFALLHFAGWYIAIVTFFQSILLYIIRRVGNNGVLAPIVAHFVYNLSLMFPFLLR